MSHAIPVEWLSKSFLSLLQFRGREVCCVIQFLTSTFHQFLTPVLSSLLRMLELITFRRNGTLGVLAMSRTLLWQWISRKVRRLNQLSTSCIIWYGSGVRYGWLSRIYIAQLIISLLVRLMEKYAIWTWPYFVQHWSPQSSEGGNRSLEKAVRK